MTIPIQHAAQWPWPLGSAVALVDNTESIDGSSGRVWEPQDWEDIFSSV